MQTSLSRTRAMLATSVVVLAGLGLLACRDSMTGSHLRDDVKMTRLVSVSPAGLEAQKRIHARNPHEWAGVAHNKILDDWRLAMRQPGVLTHNLCGYVVDFVARDERLPRDKQAPLPVRRNAIVAAAKSSSLCRSNTGISTLASRGYTRSVAEESEATAALQSLIESAIDQAESPADLAVQLNAVLDAAATLNESEQAVIGATVSVAQSSFEYWDTQYEATVNEVGAEYDQCAADRQASGYNSDAARDSCLSGSYFETSYRGWSPSGLFGPRVRGARTSVSCGPSLREGFKNVAKSDAKGAFAGAWAGAFGAAAGIVGGAILGAGSGSIWAAGENAWSTYWCIMAKK
jgi:hypothetical protein